MANKPDEKDKRLTLFSFLENLVVACFFSILLSIIIEWCLMTFYRPELGASVAQKMAMTELNYINEVTINYVFAGYSPKELSHWLLSFVYGEPFDQMKLSDWFWLQSFEEDSIVTSTLKTIISIAAEYGLSAIYVITTILARITILIFSAPLFLIAFLGGLCDGLVERELRKFGGGTESAYSYHYAKHWLFRSYFIFWFMYLAFPMTANPVFFLVPCAAVMFFLSFFSGWTFKKYF